LELVWDIVCQDAMPCRQLSNKSNACRGE
jgi:hypothetical protein